MTKTEYEYFQKFMKAFDKWVKENPQRAFEFFTGIEIERLVNVKKISFDKKEK